MNECPIELKEKEILYIREKIEVSSYTPSIGTVLVHRLKGRYALPPFDFNVFLGNLKDTARAYKKNGK